MRIDVSQIISPTGYISRMQTYEINSLVIYACERLFYTIASKHRVSGVGMVVRGSRKVEYWKETQTYFANQGIRD